MCLSRVAELYAALNGKRNNDQRRRLFNLRQDANGKVKVKIRN
jgi:hypothetical protein